MIIPLFYKKLGSTWEIIWKVLFHNGCEQQTMEALLESGYSLINEQQLINETKLSKEYMKNIDD